MNRNASVAPSRADLHYASVGALVILFALLPVFVPAYPVYLITLIMLFAYWGQAWNIQCGIAGQFTFMHPIFIGAGAYTSTLLYNGLGITPWLGMFVGACVAIVAGIPMVYVAHRIKLPPLSVALFSLAFVFVARYISEGETLLGGNDRSIFVRKAPGFANLQFTSNAGFYYTMLVLVVVIMAITCLILRSRLGLCFKAMRDNERAAEAVGVNLLRYKLTAMAISGFFTAVGGSFYAQLAGSLQPATAISVENVVKIILFVAVGGIGTLWGPIFGASLLMGAGTILELKLHEVPALQPLLYGVVVIGVLMATPKGLVDLSKRAMKRTQ
ncbi:MAG: branched-chain amino acid ABC transporter permease [Chloroflexota bacterium]|nr:MAG: branched-chain amino acid ABC transporter permease [Chloroflexota bacterium]